MKTILTFLLICDATTTFAQQEANFSIFSSDSYLFNPAASGLEKVGVVNVGTRLQWLAANDNPTTYYGSVQGQLRGKSETNVLKEFNRERKNSFETNERQFGTVKHTAGLKVISDRIGPFAKTSFQGSYAYHIPLTKTLNISAGLAVGFTNLNIDTKKARVDNPNDVAYNEFLISGNGLKFLDAAAGMTVYGKQLFVGLSTTQAFANKFKINNFVSKSSLERHWSLNFSYLLKSMEKVNYEPMLLIRKVKGAPMNVDFGIKFHYNKIYSAGVLYRTGNTLGLFLGANFAKNFAIAYTFEHYFSGKKSSLRNTNEIKLSYIFGSKRNIDKEIKDQKELNDDELKLPGEK